MDAEGFTEGAKDVFAGDAEVNQYVGEQHAKDCLVIKVLAEHGRDFDMLASLLKCNKSAAIARVVRMRKDGKLPPWTPVPLRERLNGMYREDENGCWIWTGSKLESGYGMVRCEQGHYIRVHRASWIVHRGPIPDGLLVCHRCDVPLCINPDHLFLGTSKDNTQDMIKKGRKVTCPGESNPASKHKEDDVKRAREMFASGNYTRDEISAATGIKKANLYRILTGQTWKHIA